MKQNNSYSDAMVAYMNKKYPEDRFQFSNVTGGGVDANAKMIVVSSEKYPGVEIYVRYSKNGTTETYSDNYMGVVYADDTRNALNEVLNNLGSGYSLYYEPSKYACPNEDSSISFQDYATNKCSNIGFSAVVHVSAINRELLEDRLRDSLEKSGVCCFGTIYFDMTSETFPPQNDLSAYLFRHDYAAAVTFSVDEAIHVNTLQWEQ